MQTKKINKALTSVLNKFDYTNMHRNIYTFFLGGGSRFSQTLILYHVYLKRQKDGAYFHRSKHLVTVKPLLD